MLVVPHDHGNVVPQNTDGAPLAVHSLGNDILLGKQARQFQVRVGHCTMRVVNRHQAGLDDEGKLGAPQSWSNMTVGGGRKPHTTHTGARGIMGTNSNWVIWDQLSQVGGPGGQRQSKVLEVIKLVSHCRGDVNVVLVHMPEAFL